MTKISGLTEGRIVHYVMSNDAHRPAIIVQVWDYEYGTVNLQVFTDGNNDGYLGDNGLYRVTSAIFDETNKYVGTWHWIEKA